MGRRSSIDRFPPAVRDRIAELIRSGRTIQEITDHLAAMDVDASRSAVGRYVKNTKSLMHDYLRAQEMARTWAARAGEDPNSDVGTMVGEMLKAVAFNVVSAIDPDNAEQTKSSDVLNLTRAIESLENTTHKAIARRERLRKAALDEAAQAVAGEGKKLGLSADAINRMTEAIGLL